MQNNRFQLLINRPLRAFLCTFLVFSGAIVTGQTFEDDGGELGSANSSEESVQAADTTNNESSEDDVVYSLPDNPEDFSTFTPSEGISEDFSVPFPVDI